MTTKKLKTSDVVRKLVRDVNAQALTIRAILNLTNLSDEQIQKESVRIISEYTKVQALPPDLLEGEEDYDSEDDYDGDDNFPVDVDDDNFPIHDDDYQDDSDEDYDEDYDGEDYDENDFDHDQDSVDHEKDAVNLKNKNSGRISMHGGASSHPAGAFVFGG